MLFDQNGNVVGGSDSAAHQIILADDPGSGLLEDVASGTWIYWTEPSESVSLSGISQVRAELYRVNNAFTNEGERLVSDSLFVGFPLTLPEISFGGGMYAEPEQTDDLTDSTETSADTDSTETTESTPNTEVTENTEYAEGSEEQ